MRPALIMAVVKQDALHQLQLGQQQVSVFSYQVQTVTSYVSRTLTGKKIPAYSISQIF